MPCAVGNLSGYLSISSLDQTEDEKTEEELFHGDFILLRQRKPEEKRPETLYASQSVIIGELPFRERKQSLCIGEGGKIPDGDQGKQFVNNSIPVIFSEMGIPVFYLILKGLRDC